MRVTCAGRWGLVAALALAPAAAFAGGTGTDGTSSGGTSSSGGSGSTGDSTGSVDDGGCGDCSPGTGDGGISLLNFVEGESYMVAIPLDISTSPACECDECGCFDAPAWQIRVLEGDVELEQCDGSSCVVEIPLPVGAHVLTIVASYDFSELTREIHFSIVPPQDEGPFGTEGGSGGSATQGDGGAAGSTPAERGCGCTSDPPRWIGGLGGLVVFARRRRRAR